MKRPRGALVRGIMDENNRSSFEDVPAPAAAPAKPAAKRMADRKHTSVYIPLPAFERLREIAFTERVKLHDLLMEGVDKVIAERGHPERASASAKAL